MPAITRIVCDDNKPWSIATNGYPEQCSPLDLPIPESPAALDAALAAAGWTRDERGFHCPQHDPSVLWLRIVLSTDNVIEPLPGVRLRLRSDVDRMQSTLVEAQIHFDPEMFDVENPSNGLWRVKPAGTEWPAPKDNAHD